MKKQIDYTKIEYTREWFQDKENQAHTIQDIELFHTQDCKNIIQIGEHFLLDLYPVYGNGKNRAGTDVEIWEVENTKRKIKDKIRGQSFNFKPIRKITTGKQFGYPNGYWKINSNSQNPTASGEGVKMGEKDAKLSLAKGHPVISSVKKETQETASEGEKDATNEHLGYDQPSASCSKCKGLGYLTENGTVHTCWDCLESGRLG